MEKMLGQMLGVVSDNFSVKNKQDQTVSLNVKYDFTDASDQDIKSWVCGNRRIAFQRSLRVLSDKEISELSGKTFNASTLGQKIENEDTKINRLVLNGLPVELATIAVRDPEKFKGVMQEVLGK